MERRNSKIGDEAHVAGRKRALEGYDHHDKLDLRTFCHTAFALI